MGIQSLEQRVAASFTASVGNIVFGMEDGTVSIFGLVFGVAFSTNSSTPVLLAGATGAVAAAVSMMAGSFLDADSAQGVAQTQIAHEREEIARKPQEEAQEITTRLRAAGFSDQDAQTVVAILQRTPNAMLATETAYELKIGQTVEQSPFAPALWMFGSDLIAALIPVLPFAFLPIASARILSLIVTALLLLLLGVGRGLITHRNVVKSAVTTLAIGAGAAAAGIIIGRAITGWAGA